MNIGKIVRDYRKKNRLSMDEMARRCGVSKAYIGFIESGKNPSTGKPLAPTIDTIKKLAAGMNTTIDELIPLMGNDEISLNEINFKNTEEAQTDIYGIDKQEMIDYLSKHNPELIGAYKHITENENLALLFDAAKDLTPEDLAPILAIIQNIRKAKGIE